MSSRVKKQFHTKSQEEVYRAVKSHLDDLVEEHFDDAEHCDFYLKYGSTVLEISIEPYEEDDAVIEVLAFCVQGVEPTFDLTQELLRLNSEVLLGAFSMDGRDIFFSHSFLGRRLRPEQLIASLETVASRGQHRRPPHKQPPSSLPPAAARRRTWRQPGGPIDARPGLRSSATAVRAAGWRPPPRALPRRANLPARNQKGPLVHFYTGS